MQLKSQPLLLSLLFLWLVLSVTSTPINTSIAGNHFSANSSMLEGHTVATGCTSISFNSFAWIVRVLSFHASYVFAMPSHQNSSGSVSFELHNPADGSTTQCEALENQLNNFLYGNVVYHCEEKDGHVASQASKIQPAARSTTLDFEMGSGKLRVNQTWVCTDRDPKWP